MNVKNNFFKLVQQSNNILISAHVNPDGDAIGSSFGLALVLQSLGKNAKIIRNDHYPTNLEFLKREDLYFNDDFDDIDLFIAVDSADMKRIGISKTYFDKAKSTVCIDHHITNEGYADINIILRSSSTCEMLAEMLIDYDVYIPQDAATYFYLGILTDTFRFSYVSANSTTLRVAANLLDINADKNLIHENLYEKINTNLLFFQAEVIKNATKIGDKIIAAKITRELVRKYGLDFDKIENIVSVLRSIDGIEVSAIVREDGDIEQKLSFRSQNIVDVSEIAKEFGGGGHTRAAGASCKGSVDEVFDILLNRLEKLYEDGYISR
ncbi:DHH family phosphoesterase [Helcococcus kunzii]|uniref:DHH family phosphoesterase n=1 Tax=Helcococcus kunzii TaxID=40091 RepID=UPI0024AD48A3|nr:bifunctional oligoribonuclease/PAP phosphatase NrnA [Helcococcus kunzii]